MHRQSLMTLFVLSCLLAGTANAGDWKSIVDERLPEYGHRNWIVVADSAYPKQSAPGIETVYTGAGQLEVLNYVLKAVDAAKHVRPIIMVDAELNSVPDAHAPGIEDYRAELRRVLRERDISSMSHEAIIGKLDEGARLFNILILKTDMTIPYTSVFIELDCGYWSDEQESLLRKSLEPTKSQ